MGECQIFTGADFGRSGHAGISVNGKSMSAHRVSYALANGLDPVDLTPQMIVRHTCDTPRCVRPEHLTLGSPKDNFDDMVDRNRVRNRGTGPIQQVCPNCQHRFD